MGRERERLRGMEGEKKGREREHATVLNSPVRTEELCSVNGPNILEHFHDQAYLPKMVE